MILSCSSCATRYLVAPKSIGSGGRTVRCARCGHTWFQPPPEPETPPQAAMVAALGEALEERYVERLEDANRFEVADFAAELERREAGAVAQEQDDPVSRSSGEPDPFGEIDFKPRPRKTNLPVLQPRISRGEQIGWAALALFVVAVIGGGLFFRTSVMDMWPATARIYGPLGLDGRHAAAGHEAGGGEARDYSHVAIDGKTAAANRRDGQAVLIASAMLHNQGKTRIALPPIRVEFYNDRGRVMSARSLPPPAPALEPGQSLKFEAEIADPPEGVASIEILLDTKSGA